MEPWRHLVQHLAAAASILIPLRNHEIHQIHERISVYLVYFVVRSHLMATHHGTDPDRILQTQGGRIV